MDHPNLITLITAAGALGTAAYGIVDLLKVDVRGIGLAGFDALKENLGKLTKTLEVAFGAGYTGMLEAQYRGEAEAFARTLRQGVRLGLSTSNAREVAQFLGSVDGGELHEAIAKVEKAEIDFSALSEKAPSEYTEDEKAALKEFEQAQRIIGRYEAAADARIDAGLTLAKEQYKARAKIWASVFAVFMGLAAGALMGGVEYGSGDAAPAQVAAGAETTAAPQGDSPAPVSDTTGALTTAVALEVEGAAKDVVDRWDIGQSLLWGLFVGIAAVPLAPVAKDVATAIQTAAAALRRRA
ncbi:MAG: hypothetical protein HYV27_02355 [Candidatus Hydrogenedentes bacterium]|nr:hypothetical protein [Candidatus Hydrogenedentota bacterium]